MRYGMFLTKNGNRLRFVTSTFRIGWGYYWCILAFLKEKYGLSPFPHQKHAGLRRVWSHQNTPASQRAPNPAYVLSPFYRESRFSRITPFLNIDFLVPFWRYSITPISSLEKSIIDITDLGLNPVLVLAEFFIDKLADSACAVRLFLIEDADLGGEKNFLKLKEHVYQFEFAHLAPSGSGDF